MVVIGLVGGSWAVSASEERGDPGELSVCAIARRLVEADIRLAALEPRAFVRRDPVGVELRHLLGLVRVSSWAYDHDLYSAVALPTMVLELADFKESGLLTAGEATASAELSRALERRCGTPLSKSGLLLVPPEA